jgi:hypothetical protein
MAVLMTKVLFNWLLSLEAHSNLCTYITLSQNNFYLTRDNCNSQPLQLLVTLPL